MILVAGHARFDVAHVEKVRAAIAEIEIITRAEDGCIYYAQAFDNLATGELTILEKWRDQAALDAHLRTPALQKFNAENAPYALEFEVKQFEVGEGSDVIVPQL